MPKIIMHCNFVPPFALTELFDKAARFGFDGVELRGFKPETSTLPSYFSFLEMMLCFSV